MAAPSGSSPPCRRICPEGEFALKENLRWVRRFKTAAELRHVLLACPEIYNDTRLIERHAFLSPAEYRRRQLQPLAQAVGFNPLSQKPRAVQCQCTHWNCRSSTLACHSALSSFLSAFFIVNNEIIPPP